MTHRPGFPGLEDLADPRTREALRLIWDQIHLLGRQPVVGTLRPDQRPTGLSAQQRGLHFFAIDFNREYEWNGTGWQDAPNAPQRRQIVWFNFSPETTIGWMRCDGSQGSISTKDGRTEFFKAPIVADLNGQKAWIRL